MGRPKDFGYLSDILGTSSNEFDFLVPPVPSKPNPAFSTRMRSWLSRVQDGIFFGRTNGERVRFSEPLAFPTDLYGVLTGIFGRIGTEADPGVYAILVRDSSASPRPFRVLYFGEGASMTDRVTTSHEHYDDWRRAAGGADKLLVAYHFMPGSSKSQRVSIESGLIEHYYPECNTQFNPFAGFFR